MVLARLIVALLGVGVFVPLDLAGFRRPRLSFEDWRSRTKSLVDAAMLKLEYAFYRGHLEKTSRSFHFCIERLESPFKEQVALSYLLFRVLDTIEDSPWPGQKDPEGQFEKFNRFCGKAPTEREFSPWAGKFPEMKPYGKLVKDSRHLFQNLENSPPGVRETIKKALFDMASGMKLFQEGARIKISSVLELNQYCYFVAGIVGVLLTKLFVRENRLEESRNREVRAVHFGLFLQKVNILKDIKDDAEAGRSFTRNGRDVHRSLKPNAEGALEYILNIPARRGDYRLFCSWSFFIGLRTVRFFAETGKVGKIPRAETLKFCREIEDHVGDNGWLAGQYRKWQTFAEKPVLPRSPLSRVGRHIVERSGFDQEQLKELDLI